jgi:hypothetical protein
MTWSDIRTIYTNDHLKKPLVSPATRLNAYDRIEAIVKVNFTDIFNNPALLKELSKKEFKSQLAKFKASGVLSGSEESVINGIYKILDY